MAGDKVCDDGSSNMTVLLENDTLWIPTSSGTLNGAESMVNFESVAGGEGTVDAPAFFQPPPIIKEEIGEEDYDLCNNPRGKKRRLWATQVQFLERNFEVENKLEPERKMQLAKELGLQPRQVAIWFQNRRARFKNKQLEKDYGSLKSSYDKLKLDYDNLLKEKENLNNEFVSLKEKLSGREEKKENVEAIDAMNSPKAELENPLFNSKSTTMVIPKQEDATSSAKSDLFDSDSPHSYFDPADSSQVFEPDQSDFSQDEDEFRSLLPQQQYYSKVYHESPANSCNFEFPVEDQPFWSWSY